MLLVDVEPEAVSASFGGTAGTCVSFPVGSFFEDDAEKVRLFPEGADARELSFVIMLSLFVVDVGFSSSAFFSMTSSFSFSFFFFVSSRLRCGNGNAGCCGDEDEITAAAALAPPAAAAAGGCCVVAVLTTAPPTFAPPLALTRALGEKRERLTELRRGCCCAFGLSSIEDESHIGACVFESL